MKSLTYQDPSVPEKRRANVARTHRRVWPLAVVSATVLVSLAVAFAFLLTASKKTVDALVIVTLPSGAEVRFDGKPLGPAPVKLEGVRIGTHTVQVTKEGFNSLEREIDVGGDSDDPLEFDLRPIAPPGSLARTPAEQVEEFTGLAEDALARGDLVLPVDRSVLYYADAILSLDRSNQYAHELRDRIRAKLYADARSAVAAKDSIRAKQIYGEILRAFPHDTDTKAQLAAVDEQLRREHNRVQDFVARGERALRSGALIEPGARSAYAYASRAIAVDPSNPQAIALRRRVRDKALAQALALVESNRVEEAAAMLRQLVALFPEERPIRAELDSLMEGAALSALQSHRVTGMKAYRAGNYRSAVEHLEAAIRLGAADSATRTALGLSYARLGDDANARRELEHSIVQDGSQVEALVALADMAMHRGDTRKALGYLKRARQLGGSEQYNRDRLDTMIADLERRAPQTEPEQR